MDWAEIIGRASHRFEEARTFRCAGVKVIDVLAQRFEIAFKRSRFCIRFSDAFIAPVPFDSLLAHEFDDRIGCGYLWVDEQGSHHKRVEAKNPKADLKLEWIPTFDVLLPVLLAVPGYPNKGLSLRLLKDAVVHTSSYADFPECFVVEGQLARPGDTEVWFEQTGNFLPRRVIQKDRFSASSQTMQVASDCLFFNWAFNENVDERLLKGPEDPALRKPFGID